MKIKKNCLNSTRILKDSGPLSKNKINVRWMIWFFKAGSFSDEIYQSVNIAEIFHRTIFSTDFIIMQFP